MSIVIKTWNENVKNLHTNHKSKLVDAKNGSNENKFAQRVKFMNNTQKTTKHLNVKNVVALELSL